MYPPTTNRSLLRNPCVEPADRGPSPPQNCPIAAARIMNWGGGCRSRMWSPSPTPYITPSSSSTTGTSDVLSSYCVAENPGWFGTVTDTELVRRLSPSSSDTRVELNRPQSSPTGSSQLEA